MSSLKGVSAPSLVVLAMAGLSTPAQADEREASERAVAPAPAVISPSDGRRSNFDRRPSAVLGSFNPLGSPVGVLGIEVEHAPRRWAVLAAGAGVGLGGAQGAIGARWRWIRERDFAFGLGAGASYGRFRDLDGCLAAHCYENYMSAGWVNAEASLEGRFRSGLAVRLAFGVSQKVYCYGRHCDSTFEGRTLGVSTLPFGMAGFGYAF